MAKLSELRKEAKGLGISAKVIRSAETAAELQGIIAEHSNGSSKKSAAKKAVKKAVTAKSKTTKKATKKSAAKKTAAKGSASSKSRPAAKSTTGKAKRATAANGDLKRNLLGKVNFNRTEGWNPREGSVPDVIVKALKKAKGNREAAFKALSAKLDKIVPAKTRNGRKRNLDERRNYLRYLISRNAWAFAMATGQHEPAEGRAEYGTGGTGEGNFKPAGSKSKTKAKATTTKKSTKTKAQRKAADKAKSTKKTTAKKGSTKKSGTAKAKAAGRQAAKRKASKK